MQNKLVIFFTNSKLDLANLVQNIEFGMTFQSFVLENPQNDKLYKRSVLEKTCLMPAIHFMIEFLQKGFFILCTIVGLVQLRRGHKLSTTSTSTQQKTTSCWPCGPSKLLCCTSKKAGNSNRKASSISRPSDETYFYHISESPE